MAITLEQANEYWSHRHLGLSIRAASASAGISYTKARELEQNGPRGTAVRTKRAVTALPGPVALKDLRPAAKRALHDFGYYQRRYFGRIALPWQVDGANKIVKLLGTPEKEYGVINCPPGAGKSTTFSHDIPTWNVVRNRAIRGLSLSFTGNKATIFTMAIKRTLERTTYMRPNSDDIAAGRSVEPTGILAADFGRFRPIDQEMWTASAFIVAQIGEDAISEKDPTWSAYGKDQDFLGGRFDLVVADDLVDPKKLRTVDQIEDLETWWDQYGETRLEPGGLLLLVGQRLGANDLYHHCLEKTTGDDLDDDFDAALLEDENLDDAEADYIREYGDNRFNRMYHHIIYPAHDETKCIGEHGPTRQNPTAEPAKPQPEGCLLFPHRLPWRELRRIQANNEELFEVTYQQGDSDPEGVLVNPIWVSGSLDGEFPGCWDKDRDRMELPEGIVGPLYSIATADPSPSKFWAIQWWVVQPETGFRFLMASERRAMEAPDFLEWNVAINNFTGVMREWQEASMAMGIPITHWIVESNACATFLLQYDHTRRFKAKYSVTILAHETHRNKSNQEFGVQTIREHYKYGRVRLPGKGMGRLDSLKLVGEVTRYSTKTAKLMTDDQVMAHWFLEWNLPRIIRPEAGTEARQWRPSWMRRSA